ncbi:TAP-like protein-domain-containing protein [Daldinia loculata]|uniref:TAP-like protein-domain-containing protein n=1 Tax=Daldinia loculata TaxID=103429 RepID=UPI0020C4FAB0|nr:TAP-like protein-domain-containing protein [Daldinia loculata]KAI1651056.1 TAP-like protein-domain-containing protein [Daldinia loculata]
MKSAVLFTGLLVSSSQYATAQSSSSFDWTKLRPSASLEYSECYGSLKCAKLGVPMDWLSNSTRNATEVSLAVIALPATVPEDDPSFGGTIIVNPGGPGGSGVEFVLEAGELLQGVADGNKHYEILSFDPRGVGYSEPKADCYNDELARDVTALSLRGMGPLSGGVNVVRRQAALLSAYGSLCEGEKIHKFMSTASVARDMVQIVDKIDELRSSNGTSSAKLRMRGGPRRMHSRQEKDLPRIQYWGFSYGTVLGNYFASMFPGRVDRMILEGVVDIHDYNAAAWSKNLQDTQEDYDQLFINCFEAGSHCALHKPGDSGPSDIRARVDAFLEQLDESPAQIVTNSSIEEITRADVTTIIFQALYQPQEYFSQAAKVIAKGMEGDFSTVYASLGTPKSAEYCPTTIPKTYTWTQDAEIAVGCGDAESANDQTIPEFQSYLTDIQEQSPDFGPAWAQLRLACRGWRVRPKYRFTGPFTSPAADPSGAPGKPKAPILFVSSQWDPVTPYANAVAMAKEHAGARVLLQESPGHTTLFSPGKCREDYVKKYFETGELPPEGTVCQPDCKPFRDCPSAPTSKRSVGVAAEKAFPPPNRGPLGIAW